MEETAEKAKKLIFPGIDPEPSQLELLDEIDRGTKARLLGLLKSLARVPVVSVPGELSYIVVEVDVKRYNRIGSEGLKSETMGGHSATYDTASDFNEYMGELKAWASKNDASGEEGKRRRAVRFI